MGKEWGELTDDQKKVYHKQASNDKKRYEDEKVEWEKTHARDVKPKSSSKTKAKGKSPKAKAPTPKAKAVGKKRRASPKKSTPKAVKRAKVAEDPAPIDDEEEVRLEGIEFEAEVVEDDVKMESDQEKAVSEPSAKDEPLVEKPVEEEKEDAPMEQNDNEDIVNAGPVDTNVEEQGDGSAVEEDEASPDVEAKVEAELEV
jgi:hypothetical protein